MVLLKLLKKTLKNIYKTYRIERKCSILNSELIPQITIIFKIIQTIII